MKANDRDGGCERGDLLVTVLCGEATDRERSELEAHRRECASCEQEFASLSSVREELHSWELDAIPHIRVEVRPTFMQRLRQALTIMPLTARLAGAAACALVLLALTNTQIGVGPNGVSFSTHVLPGREAASAPAGPTQGAASMTEEQVRRIVAEQVAGSVHQELAEYRALMEKQLNEFELRLASANSADDVRRLTVQVSTQRRRIEQLQKDVDRTAGYDGSDLFGSVLSPREPGS